MALGSRSEFQCGGQKPPQLLGVDFGESWAACILVQHRFKPGLQSCLSFRQGNVLLQSAQALHPARTTIEHGLKAGNCLGRHDGWNPERWNLTHVDAMKRRRSNPDNRHWVPVHQYLSAHDIRSASELVFPEVVREHNHRTRPGRLVIIDRQQPAQRGAHSEYRKVCARHEFRGSRLGVSARREVDRRRSTAEYAVEESLLLLEIAANRVGH